MRRRFRAFTPVPRTDAPANVVGDADEARANAALAAFSSRVKSRHLDLWACIDAAEQLIRDHPILLSRFGGPTALLTHVGELIGREFAGLPHVRCESPGVVRGAR